MDDILITVRHDDYARLIADSERLNILRNYLDMEKYLDNQMVRMIVGEDGSRLIKVGDSGAELVR